MTQPSKWIQEFPGVYHGIPTTEDMAKQSPLYSLFENEYKHYADCSIKNCGIYGSQAIESLKSGKGLFINGDVGRGKTYLALSCFKWWLSQGKTGYFFTINEIMQRLHWFISQNNDSGMSLFLKHISSLPLLIIDDLGTQNSTKWADEKIYDIYNSRWLKSNEVITITTSNYSPSKLTEKFYDNVMGARIIDRIAAVSKRIEIIGESKRIA